MLEETQNERYKAKAMLKEVGFLNRQIQDLQDKISKQINELDSLRTELDSKIASQSLAISIWRQIYKD